MNEQKKVITKQQRHRAKVRKIAPQTRPYRLKDIDRRTREAILIEKTRKDLIEHVGGCPSAVEAALIERCCQLMLKVAILDCKLDSGNMTAHDSAQYLAWSNSLSRTLAKLGNKPTRPRSGGAALDDHLAALEREGAA